MTELNGTRQPKEMALHESKAALDPTDLECADFQARMAERIGAGEDLQVYPHLLTCERCRSLVNDLESIADAARQLFREELEPETDLWPKIELAIERGEL
jgi:hypothetical protein